MEELQKTAPEIYRIGSTNSMTKGELSAMNTCKLRRFLAVTFCILMVFSSLHAMADDDKTNYGFSLTMQSTNASGPYSHSPEDTAHTKKSNKKYIEIHHHVNNAIGSFTNHMCGFVWTDGIYAGKKWMAPNDTYYATNVSGNMYEGCGISPAGRANTDYNSVYHVETISISGQFRVH